MEEKDPTNGWFVTHEGKQYGPVAFEDLQFEKESGRLDPRLDLVWKKGMDQWIPAGELEGLYERNPAREPAAAADPFGNEAESLPIEPRAIIHKPGLGRMKFILFGYVLPLLWIVGINLLVPHLTPKFPSGQLSVILGVLFLVPLLILLSVILSRFRNLGMSRAWFLGLPVPLLNFWLGFRLFACPENYALHKKLDGIGKILAVLYFLPVAAAICFAIFAAVILNNSAEDDPYRVAIEDFIRSTPFNGKE